MSPARPLEQVYWTDGGWTRPSTSFPLGFIHSAYLFIAVPWILEQSQVGWFPHCSQGKRCQIATDAEIPAPTLPAKEPSPPNAPIKQVYLLTFLQTQNNRIHMVPPAYLMLALASALTLQLWVCYAAFRPASLVNAAPSRRDSHAEGCPGNSLKKVTGHLPDYNYIITSFYKRQSILTEY